MATIEQLQKALEHIEGRTPKEVLDAFLPEKKEIAGRPLVEITFGHSLILSNFDHPLSQGKLEGWSPQDVAVALWVFTNKSDQLTNQIKDGTFEPLFFEFMETLKIGDAPKYSALLMAHYLNSIQTGLEMHDPKSKASQKKTLLGGCYRVLREFVASITGILTTLRTSFRSAKP